MKIGLLTYHVSSNIGAMLQTYATCRALKELGHEVVLVDIRQQEKKHSGIKKIASDLIFCRQSHQQKLFRDQYYPPMTNRYHSVDELINNPPQVDCLVVGSDQTWNPAISKGIAMAYFLNFGGESIKRFSYASSFGMEQWEQSEKMTRSVDQALHNMQCISVREQTGVDICRDTFGLKAHLVVDPTMLFNGYPEITGHTIPQRNELLCYKLTRNTDFYNHIAELKKIMRLPARLLNNAYLVRGLRYTYPPSVEDWIARIGGARFVLTDSFHGVVFSLLYQRQFAVIRNHNGRDQRFEDLLAEVGLENRIFDSVEQMCHEESWREIINYSKVLTILEQFRSSSWDYLKQALSK